MLVTPGKPLQKEGCTIGGGLSTPPIPCLGGTALAEGPLCSFPAPLGAAVGHCVRLALPAAGCPARRGDRQGLG